MWVTAMLAPYTRSASTWRHALITAAGYALLATLGLTLVGGGRYASPIFPAAGLALTASLVYGATALPAVFLGSFLVDLGNGLLLGRSAPQAALIACGLALGATLQAMVLLR